MRRLRPVHSLLIVLSILVLPSTIARASDAGAKGVVTTTIDVLNPVTFGGTSLKPGSYTVKADETTVTLTARGKTVAQAKVEWKDSAQKSKSTSMLAENGIVKEIHFSGNTRYVELTN